MWMIARKKPVEIRYREVIPDGEELTCISESIKTREGTIVGVLGVDFIIEGIEGELYPIKKDIFYKTYDSLSETKKEGGE